MVAKMPGHPCSDIILHLNICRNDLSNTSVDQFDRYRLVSPSI